MRPCAQHAACRNAGWTTSFQLLNFYCTLAMRRIKIKLRRGRTAGILTPALRQALDVSSHFMTDTLMALDKPNKLDTKGWSIDFSLLLTPKRGVYPFNFVHDELQESPDAKFACLFYTIKEYRMGSESALVGIFENKRHPKLLAQPKDQWFDFQGNRSSTFSDNFLFLRKLAYHENEQLSGTPFVIFDLDNKVFSIIDFDSTSIYYSPVKITDTIYKFNLDTPNELKHNLPNRHGQTFDLTTLNVYSFDNLDSILELYFDEKKNGC